MVETMKAGRLDATFMIAPLAMKLREQGLRVKICYLGHRDGSEVMVRDLVRGIGESGEWAETHRGEAAKVVAPMFRQDEKLIRHVLTEPPDRVSYRMLTPTDAEIERIEEMGEELGVLDREKHTPM